MPALERVGQPLRARWRRARASTTTVSGLIEPAPAARPVLWALLVALLLLNGGLGVVLWSGLGARETAKTELSQRQNELRRLQVEASPEKTAEKLANQLPRYVDGSAELARIQRLAVEKNVTLANLAPSKDSPSNETAGLRRVAWDAQLSGSYAAIKSMLADLLEQSPGLWLTRLHLKAVGNGVEAQVTLQAWSLDTAPQSASDEAPK